MTDSDHQRKNESRLLGQSEINSCLWINQYILDGYRPPNLSNSFYIKSTLKWNNETVNIWSHLLGCIYFIWFLYHANFNTLSQANATRLDYIVINLCLIGFQICMLLSVTYHVFGSANESQRKKLLRLDIFGISAGFTGVYLIGVYASFVCYENWQHNYLALIGLIAAITAYLPSKDVPMYLIQSSYTAIALFSLLPAAHWIVLHGGIQSGIVEKEFPKLLTLYLLLVLAFLFYLSRIPERILPGKFDLIGCSHQWWHLLILSAMIYWSHTCLSLLVSHRAEQNVCHLTFQRFLNSTNNSSL